MTNVVTVPGVALKRLLSGGMMRGKIGHETVGIEVLTARQGAVPLELKAEGCV